MVAKDKLKAEGGLSETKIILGWHFNFRTLTVTLPKHKLIAWPVKIQQMISMNKTSKKTLKSTIRQMGHVGFGIPWVYHFLSCLQFLLASSRNRRFIAINDKCIKDLELIQSISKRQKKG
jgi:hypothetical protein